MRLIDSTAKISPLAIVEEGAQIGAHVEIGPLAKMSKLEQGPKFIRMWLSTVLLRLVKTTIFSNLRVLEKLTKI